MYLASRHYFETGLYLCSNNYASKVHETIVLSQPCHLWLLSAKLWETFWLLDCSVRQRSHCDYRISQCPQTNRQHGQFRDLENGFIRRLLKPVSTDTYRSIIVVTVRALTRGNSYEKNHFRVSFEPTDQKKLKFLTMGLRKSEEPHVDKGEEQTREWSSFHDHSSSVLKWPLKVKAPSPGDAATTSLQVKGRGEGWEYSRKG